MDTSTLLFNIIYTPRTVATLSPFVHSLLEWSDCKYRLIGNGCDRDEQKMLEDLAATDPHLSYMNLSEDEIYEHFDVLNMLQPECEDEWFCCIDSDILAKGEFQSLLESIENNDAAISSCLPVWAIDSDKVLPTKFLRLQGTHIDLENGLHIGCTYFMIYNNNAVNMIRKEYGVGFERCWWDTLPEEQRTIIQKLGADKTDYDTAIVLNLLLTHEGYNVRYIDLPNLIHIGGVSEQKASHTIQFTRGTYDNWSIKLRGTPFSGLIMMFADLYYGKANIVEDLCWEEYINLASRARRRRAASIYFSFLLNRLLAGEQLPQLPHMANKHTEANVKAAAAEVITAYQKYIPN